MAWEIFERIYSGHWFFSSYNCRGFVYDFPRLGVGKYITQCIFVMEDGVCKFIFDDKEFDAAANYNAERLLNDSQWRAWLYKKIDYYTTHFFLAGEKLLVLPLASYTKHQLARVLNDVTRLQRWHQMFSIVANGVVLDGRNHLSNRIRQELMGYVSNPARFNEYWSLLTGVTKMSLRQRKEYVIAQLAERSARLSAGEVERALRRLHAKYCWLDYQYLGPAATLEQFKHEFEAARKNNKNLYLPEELKELKHKQDKLMTRLGFKVRARFLIKLAQYVIWQKGYRKDMQYHSFYCYEPYFREVARRKHLGDWRLVPFLRPWEVERFVEKNLPPVSELAERRRYSVFINKVNSSSFKVGASARLFARTLHLEEDYRHLSEVKGQCAFTGKVQGSVKIIQTPKDMVKMKQGDILVSQATSPDLLPAMRKAAAIVTNTGGLICHAAITSRELKIPCVVGTAQATLVFKDGDKVEVDATQGFVRKIQK